MDISASLSSGSYKFDFKRLMNFIFLQYFLSGNGIRVRIACGNDRLFKIF